MALGVSDRYDEAAAHFEKALQIDPDFYDGLVVMGVTRAHQGRLPEAIEYFQAAIRSQPDAPKAHVQLAHGIVDAEPRSKPRLRRCAARYSLHPKTQTFGLTWTRAGIGGQNTGGY